MIIITFLSDKHDQPEEIVKQCENEYEAGKEVYSQLRTELQILLSQRIKKITKEDGTPLLLTTVFYFKNKDISPTDLASFALLDFCHNLGIKTDDLIDALDIVLTKK